MAVHYTTLLHSISDKVGMVIGSQNNWVEIMCLRNGARKVNKVVIQNALRRDFHPLIFSKYIRCLSFEKNFAEFQRI